MIVLCGHGWDDIVTSVHWVDDDGNVMVRILSSNGSAFEREESSPDLTHVWWRSSLYLFYRPVVVTTLQEGLWLLGNDIAVLDNYPDGNLEAQWRLNRRW